MVRSSEQGANDHTVDLTSRAHLLRYVQNVVNGDDIVPTVSEARDTLSELVNRAAFGKERIALSRHGKPVAAIVSAEDLELLERLEDAADLRQIAAALSDAENAGQTISWDAVR